VYDIFNYYEKELQFKHLKGEDNINFTFQESESVYFNIRGKMSVIQTSFKKGKCNLLNFL